DPNFNLDTEYYEEEVSFALPLKLLPDTKDGRYQLKVTANWVTCNDRLCLPPKEGTLRVDVAIGTGAAIAAETTGTTGNDRERPGTTATTGTTGTKGTTGTESAASAPPKIVDMAAAEQASTLSAYVGVAALMGALSLLTPCVFPMVPITVSYFTNRARKSRREAITQALIYGFGIIFTFTGLGFTLDIVFGASGLNRFAADPWLNIAVTAMFIAFAFSLFGIWEMALPSSWLTKASKAGSGKGRIAGTLLMGPAFSLTSLT